MEAVFSLQYPEYIVAHELSRHLKKADGFSVCIPLSRQQKTFDLLVHDLKAGSSATIQVKSSRSYVPRSGTSVEPELRYEYLLWFKALVLEGYSADFYAFVGIYPRPSLVRHGLSRSRSPKKWWSQFVLVLSKAEVKRLMRRIRRNQEHFFYVSFDSDLERIALTRGTGRTESWREFLLSERAGSIREFLAT